jgi:hypothetical protein
MGLAGAGIALVATGIVTGALFLSDKNRTDDHCDAMHACDRTGLDAAQSAGHLATATTVLWSVGVACAGAGAYLLLARRRSPPSAVAALPWVSPSSIGVGVTAGF